MATWAPADRTATSEASTKEGPTEERLLQTPDRRHVDNLLDISEEGFLKDLEPHEHHPYSGWEEAVRGWTRAAPLSSIFVSPKRNKNRTTKRADSPGRLSVDLALHNTEKSAKKSTEMRQSSASWSDTSAAAAAAAAASEATVFDAFWRNMPEMLPEENAKKKGSQKDHPPKSKSAKNSKSIQRCSNTVVPIKQFTFLPPIEELQLSPQLLNEQLYPQRPLEGDSLEKNSFALDKKGGMKGTRVDTVMNPDSGLYSKLHVSQCNSQLLSAFSVSIPSRYQVSLPSNQTHASIGKRAIYSGSGTHDAAPMYALSL